ncbi:MAG: nickel-dependent hydrogenase large subunit [Candidatus Woesearchaeota archaeon]
MPKTSKSREITLNHITKIEGHAKLALGIENGKVTKCELGSTEGARYFEGLVKGRQFYEAHEMTSRICGICSSAHVVAALMSVENAIGFKPSEQTKQLRVLLTLGERIRSHATHLYFLALPDYMGYESALAMAKKFKPQLMDALTLMKAGNQVIKTLAARDLHPVSASPGGWLKLPTKEALLALRDQLKGTIDAADRTAKLFSSLKYPEFQSDAKWFSLKNPDEYAVLYGDIVSEDLTFKEEQYLDFIKEHHEEYSSANFVVRADKRYFVGALARFNNNSKQLRPRAAKLLKASPLKLPSRNPYLQNIAQAVELMHASNTQLRYARRLSQRKKNMNVLNHRQEMELQRLKCQGARYGTSTLLMKMGLLLLRT